MSEVWITGVGVVGPHGLGIDAVLESASSDASAYAPWPAEQDPPGAGAVIGAARVIPKERFFTERQLRQVDRVMAMSTCAAGQALENAGLADGGIDRDGTAVFFATSRAERTSMLRFTQPILDGKPRALNPANFPWMARNISCGQIAIRFGLRGPSTTLASGSLAALEAVGRAYDFLRLGRARTAVVTAAEILSKFALYSFRAEHGEDCARPAPAFFGRTPGRLIPSEGGVALVLERADAARARGAAAYARVRGWRCGRLGGGPWGEGLLGAWTRLLAEGGLSRSEVALLSACSGGGARTHELAEAHALSLWAKDADPPTLFCAPRSFSGEGECWTGLLQAALAAACLRARRAPPTRHTAHDAPQAVRERAQGGALSGAAALVSGLESDGRYGVLHLERGDA